MLKNGGELKLGHYLVLFKHNIYACAFVLFFQSPLAYSLLNALF